MRRLLRKFKYMAAATAIFAALSGPSLALELEELEAKERSFAENYVVGTTVFVLLHEVGHMLAHEYGLPIIGEEDAVDAFATIVMLESGTRLMDKAVAFASQRWKFAATRDNRAMMEKYADVHSLSEQRSYRIACMMFGKDSRKFESFAKLIDYPEKSIDNCGNDYDKNLDAWMKLLAPHLNEGDMSRLLVVNETAVEDPTSDYGLVQTLLRDRKVLEQVAEMVSKLFSLKRNITISARYCSQEGDSSEKDAQNAFWFPTSGVIKFCYEEAVLGLQDAISVIAEQRAKADWFR